MWGSGFDETGEHGVVVEVEEAAEGSGAEEEVEPVDVVGPHFVEWD